jgi:hypothetical protein
VRRIDALDVKVGVQVTTILGITFVRRLCFWRNFQLLVESMLSIGCRHNACSFFSFKTASQQVFLKTAATAIKEISKYSRNDKSEKADGKKGLFGGQWWQVSGFSSELTSPKLITGYL